MAFYSPPAAVQPPKDTEDEKEEIPVAELAAVSVSSRIPEFWPDLPRLWFVQVEAVLAPQKLSDEAKFNLVITKLGKDIIQQVSDILIQPPDTKKYEALKARLLALYEISKNQEFHKLLKGMELGDQKPSQLLQGMRNLARDKMPNETLSYLWQEHLPSTIRAVLAVSADQDLDNLAKIADKILENSRPYQVASVQQQSTSSSSTPQMDNGFLLNQIAALSLKVMQLEKSLQRNNRGRSAYRNGNRSRNVSRGRSQSRGPRREDWLCFYHYKYKADARKCVQPCAWKDKKEQPEN